MIDIAPAPPAATPASRWLREGLRVAFFRRPEIGGLVSSPAMMAGLFAFGYVLEFVFQRATLLGHPTFSWMGLLGGWVGTGLDAWLCWLVAIRSRREGRAPVEAAVLFTLLCAFAIVALVVETLVYVPIVRWGAPVEEWSTRSTWIAFAAGMGWLGLAQTALFWRVIAHGPTRVFAALVVALVLAVGGVLNPVRFWWPEQKHEASEPARLELAQEVMEGQPRLLAAALDDLKPQRPGVVDLYAITYAPYASQDVFMRESATVADTMARRFDAGGRTVQLVDNAATARTLPWATPLNLQRTIQRMAARMDREEDVLFIHLTSHGGADGELATDFWPLEIDPVSPAELKRWLDDAGVRWRVISVSACFSGSWIAPLAGDGTLVMTAADATHTSYGCGSKSPLTFFGQAMYVDALQSTWSFEKAHAQARELIARREREAGKDDGYSNPQISVGEGIRARLLRLQAERARADVAAGAASAPRPSSPRPAPAR
jgi:hypothetical protein